jgi:uncharacterized protein (DUF2147 family)
VIGFAPAPANMDVKTGVKNAAKLCGNKFRSTWAPGSDRIVGAWRDAEEIDWDQGFSTIICTVEYAGGGSTTGQISPPASDDA